MIIKGDCVCPGLSLTYECTVKGTVNGFTVWRGSAFDCASNEIILRHRRFTSEEGAQGECNRGLILGSSLRIVDGSFYTSQLSIRVSPEVIGKTIECILDDTNVTSKSIGNATINITTGKCPNTYFKDSIIMAFFYTDPFPPPGEVSINLTALGSRQFSVNWSPVAPDCPAIHYNILASNCGSCPTDTNHATVTCINVPTNQKTLCTFALRTVVCGYIAGILSNPISVSLSESSSIRETIINSDVNDNGNEILIRGK